MELAVGAILEGRVSGITKFGAFISLPGGKTGMVHISEIAHAYVSDINEYLHLGQEVRAMVISIDPAGKINLSIKRTTEPPQRQEKSPRQEGRGDHGQRNDRNAGRGGGRRQSAPKSASGEPQSFDDMLKQFMADSDSKISSIRQYSDHRTKNKRRQ